MPSKKDAKKNKIEIKVQKTQKLTLTQFELLHLRDIMTVALPPAGEQTVSQALALAEGRGGIEARLWRKIARACVEQGLPMGDDAPDYVIAPTATPPMSVFQVTHEVAVAPPPALTINEADESDHLFRGKRKRSDEEE